MYEDFDAMLNARRAVPLASPDLAERIIAEALRRPRREQWNIGTMWENFLDLFLLPQPAFAMAIVLITGVTFGFNGQAQSVLTDTQDEMVSAYSLVADDYEDGALL